MAVVTDKEIYIDDKTLGYNRKKAMQMLRGILNE
jgi:hypothetical protein